MKTKLTKDEVEYLIKSLDFEFMGNMIRESEVLQNELANTFSGSFALLGYRVRELGKSILDSVKEMKR